MLSTLNCIHTVEHLQAQVDSGIRRNILEEMLLKISEVCSVLRLGRSTVYQLLDKPDGLPTVRIGRAVRIPTESVKEWITKNQTPAEGVAPRD